MARVVRTVAKARPGIRDTILAINPNVRNYHSVRRAYMNFIIEEIAQRHWEAFNQKMMLGSDEFNRKWAPLRPKTIEKKGHNLIGYETGHLRDSFKPGYTTRTGRYIPGHADQYVEVGPYSFQFGTTAVEKRNGQRRPKAGFFHLGRRGQARREFWRQREIARWVKSGIKKAIPKVARLIK